MTRSLSTWLHERSAKFPAAFQRFAVHASLGLVREAGLAVMQELQTLSHHECSRVSDGGFGDQSAAQGDLARQLASNRAPAKSAPNDGENLQLLPRKTGFPAARRRDHKGHADLIRSEKSCV